MDVNVCGIWFMINVCLLVLWILGCGVIVNLFLDMLLWGVLNLLVYVVSKSVVIGMICLLVCEVGVDNIIVNVVVFGLMLVEVIEYVLQVCYQYYLDGCVLQCDQLLEDVCGVVVFVLLDMVCFFIGQVMVVNGGFVMY